MENTEQTLPTELPTGRQAAYIKNHEYATNFRDAHPIDAVYIKDVCDRKLGPVLAQCDLAAMQAVLSYTDLLNEHATLIDVDGNKEYYQTSSLIFYKITEAINDRYKFTVNVDNVSSLVEMHTRQYLFDVHGFNSTFEYEPTICDVYNNPDVEIKQPDNAQYTHVDSRGIVFEQGTHVE